MKRVLAEPLEMPREFAQHTQIAKAGGSKVWRRVAQYGFDGESHSVHHAFEFFGSICILLREAAELLPGELMVAMGDQAVAIFRGQVDEFLRSDLESVLAKVELSHHLGAQ